MSLKEKSEKLKGLVSKYSESWLLGDLAFLIQAGRDRARDQLGMLSSPMRQLFYLGGLNISTEKQGHVHTAEYNPEEWNEIVNLLNSIEQDYEALLLKGITSNCMSVKSPNFN